MKRVPAEGKDLRPARIAWVAEAPAAEEVYGGRPLIGRSGRMFNSLLRHAKIERSECLVTNVLDFKLPDNDLKAVCITRKEALEYKGPFEELIHTSIISGGYMDPVIGVPQLNRLYAELELTTPNVIGALGGLAAWALLGVPGHGAIKKIRGTIQPSLVGIKVIPTVHPAYVLRQYNYRPLVWRDYLKIAKESRYSDYAEPDGYRIEVAKTVEEVENFLLWAIRWRPRLAVDIETSHGQIDCIGFGNTEYALVVPIFDHVTGKNYWSRSDEIKVRLAIGEYLRNPLAPKIFQNGSYDVQWLWERWHIKVHGYAHDTRLLHHSLWPELPKDLATMASLHTDMPGWKPIKGKREKRED